MAVRLHHNEGDFIDPAGAQFEILKKIKQGGMGTVYQVLKVPTNTVYAAKECDLLDDPRGKQMSRRHALQIFRREGSHIESLNCEGIPRGFMQEFPQIDLRVCLKCGNPVAQAFPTCQVCQVGTGDIHYNPQKIDMRCYLFMDYIEGKDLDERAQEISHPVSRDDAARIVGWMREVGKTLYYIHTKDLIHRDIKPQNIRIARSGQRVYLLDFGLLRLGGAQPSSSKNTRRMTAAIGTAGYAPPEQTSGQPCKESDIFAFAITLMEVFSGLKPENPKDMDDILNKAPKAFIPFISTELAEVIARSLNLNPKMRPAMTDWLRVLETPFKTQYGLASGTRIRGQRKSPKSQPSQANVQKTRMRRAFSQKLLYFAIAGFLATALIFWGVFGLRKPPVRFSAVARPDSVIYVDVKKSAVKKMLSGGERLTVHDAGQRDYWLEVSSVNDISTQGYIPRGKVDIYEKRF